MRLCFYKRIPCVSFCVTNQVLVGIVIFFFGNNHQINPKIWCSVLNLIFFWLVCIENFSSPSFKSVPSKSILVFFNIDDLHYCVGLPPDIIPVCIHVFHDILTRNFDFNIMRQFSKNVSSIRKVRCLTWHILKFWMRGQTCFSPFSFWSRVKWALLDFLGGRHFFIKIHVGHNSPEWILCDHSTWMQAPFRPPRQNKGRFMHSRWRGGGLALIRFNLYSYLKLDKKALETVGLEEQRENIRLGCQIQ